jgi:hypothetical protein
MLLRTVAFVGIVGLLGALVVAPGDAQVRPSKRDAQTMKQKVAAIAARGGAVSKEPLRTTVTETELNSYLVYELGDALPSGVVDPAVTIMGTNRVSGRAVVDLDAVRKTSGSTSLFDPRSYLTGHLPVNATGLLRTGNGVGRFELQSTTVGGVPIPKVFLQEIVTYYSRTAQKPDGISLDDEFVLPARIREIQVEPGHAIVVQ